MPSAEKVNLGTMCSQAITTLYTHGLLTDTQRDAARRRLATVKDDLTVEHVSNRYRFSDQCPSCGALPCDQTENPWQALPWLVHFDMAHYPRFLIDGRDANNPDMFLGYRICGVGAVAKQSLTTGEGGRLAFHRSHFVEELPA